MSEETHTQTDGVKDSTLDSDRLVILRTEVMRLQNENDSLTYQIQDRERSVCMMLRQDMSHANLSYAIGIATGVSLCAIIMVLAIKYLPKASV